jgi:prophage tail gpP-like protein
VVGGNLGVHNGDVHGGWDSMSKSTDLGKTTKSFNMGLMGRDLAEIRVEKVAPRPLL